MGWKRLEWVVELLVVGCAVSSSYWMVEIGNGRGCAFWFCLSRGLRLVRLEKTLSGHCKNAAILLNHARFVSAASGSMHVSISNVKVLTDKSI